MELQLQERTHEQELQRENRKYHHDICIDSGKQIWTATIHY